MTAPGHAPLTPEERDDLLIRIAAGRLLAGDPSAALRLLERIPAEDEVRR